MKKILAMLLVSGVCVFGSMAAQAQTAPQPGMQSARMEHMLEQLQSRFATANTTHDGRLTEAQAAAGMPMVAKHFNEIDVNKAGYVTLAQIEAYMQQNAAAR